MANICVAEAYISCMCKLSYCNVEGLWRQYFEGERHCRLYRQCLFANVTSLWSVLVLMLMWCLVFGTSVVLYAFLPNEKMRSPVVHKQFSVRTSSLNRVAYLGRRIFNMPLGLRSSRTISLAALGQRNFLVLACFFPHLSPYLILLLRYILTY